MVRRGSAARLDLYEGGPRGSSRSRRQLQGAGYALRVRRALIEGRELRVYGLSQRERAAKAHIRCRAVRPVGTARRHAVSVAVRLMAKKRSALDDARGTGGRPSWVIGARSAVIIGVGPAHRREYGSDPDDSRSFEFGWDPVLPVQSLRCPMA